MGILKFGYKKVSANKAMIITGKRLGNPDKDPRIFKNSSNGTMMKIVRGGAEWIPPYQLVEVVPLNSIQIALVTPQIYTKNGVPIIVEATATLRIGDKLSDLALYAEQFLGKKEKEIVGELKPILEGNLRAIVARLDVLTVNNSREKFIEEVIAIAEPELNKMGLEILSIVLDDVRDSNPNNGFLSNLGRKVIAEANAEATQAESNANLETERILALNTEKEIEAKKKLALAKTKSDNDVSLAKAEAEQLLNEKNTELNLKLNKKRLEAQADEQVSTLEVKANELSIKQKDADIKSAELVIAANREAEIEVIKAKAEAEIDKVNAEAEAHAERVKGEAEAAIIKAKAEAEAEAVRSKLVAEAEGIEAKAEAMEKYGEAAILEMVIGILPELAKELSAPLSAINEVKLFQMGNDGEGVNEFTKSSVGGFKLVQDLLQESAGISLKELMQSRASYGRNQLTPVENNNTNNDINIALLKDDSTDPSNVIEEEIELD